MAIANNKDLTHVVRTTQQWQSSYDKYECIPEGVLCIEFTTSGQALAKIGNGRDIFSKLPYIGGADLTNYYTKQETTQCVQDILKTQKVIRIKGILTDKNKLPSHAECGDLYFVISQNQSSSNKYDEYVYSPSNTWENLGSIPIDIDLSEYAKIVYVDEKIDEVNERIDDIEQHGTHTHANKDILDLITAVFTAEEKDKLSTLYNYDDSELRKLITQASHTHSNKDILDAISAPFTKEDKSKLDQLNPYDDSILKEKITALERLAHEHSNKRILDRTTASFTTEYERKMRWIRLYTGCTGMEEGIAGLVPAAQAGEEDYVLSGSGEWVPQTGGGGTYELPIATTSTLGGIKVGDGLEIDANGKLSVVGGGGGGDSIAEGDGITITTDPQTGVKTISVNTGDHLSVDSQTGELNVSGVMEEFNIGKGLELVLPTLDTLPAGYGHVDYVKTSGAAYAYLDYYVTVNTKVVGTATCDVFNNDAALFGTRQGPGNNEFVMWMQQQSTNPTNMVTGFVYGRNSWGTSTDANNGRTAPYHQGDQYTFEASVAGGLKINNQLLHNVTNYGDPSYTKLCIFACNGYSGGIYNGKMYQFKLYENDTLSAKLIPAVRLSDNAVGFYDVINDIFYISSASTPFTTDMSTLIIDDPTKVLNAKIGNGLQFDSNNAIEVNTGDGLFINQDNELEVNVGDGLQINQDGELEIDPSIIPEVMEYEAGEAIEITEVTRGDEFRVLNQEYFFDTRGLTCGLGARIWTTINDGDILAAMCIHNNGGNQVPLFVGLTEDSVKVSQNYNSTILGPNGSFDYQGKTWYFTADYALSGTDGQDTQGHIQTLPTTYSFNSTPSNFVPAAKDLIDLAVLLSDLEYPVISVKYNRGLTVNQDNELEVNIGTGLEFDQVTGAINVTGGTGGDTVEAGDGIEITTDQQTGVKTIGINVGDGLEIDPITNKLFVNGQLPEGTIIKKMTYIGDGSYTNSNIHFDKKPLAILSLYGYAGPTNLNIFISASPAPIDSPYLHGIWGGQSGTTGYEGTACRAEMSYNDSTNVLTLYHPSDEGISFNISGQTYQLYYLTKGHTGSGTSVNNEVSIVKSFTYTGTDTSTNTIQFPETPDMLLSITGPGGDNTTLSSHTTTMDADSLVIGCSDGYNNNGTIGCTMSFNSATNVLTLSSSRSSSWCLNMSGATYTVFYTVNEVISNNEVNEYIAGEGISIHALDVPTEYTRVKALSSTDGGNQYIDTGYKINPNTVIELSAVFYKYGSDQWKIPLGTRNRSDYASNGMLFLVTWQTDRPGNNPSLWIERTQSVAPSDRIDSFYNDIVNIRIAGTSLTCTNTRTGVTTVLDTATAMPISQYDLFVFATNDHGNMMFHTQMDLYSLTISESDTVIHQYIPCKRDSDNKYGLYDTINQEFKLSPNNALFTYVAGAPSGDDPLIEEISLLPATEDTLGGIKIGDGLAIDEDGVVSTTNVEYEAGQGIEFITTEDGFNVKNKEYYFTDAVSCQINGTTGPRSYTRTSTDPCLLAIAQAPSSGTMWTCPLAVGLTENSVKYSNSYDGVTIGPDDSFEYKGYTWYITWNYGLMNSTGIDLMGNVPSIDTTSIDISNRDNLYLLGQALIDAAELIQTIVSMNVWNGGTGWTNGDYYSGTSDQFTTDWYYTYHYDPTAYIPVPTGALKVRVIGISNENDSHFEGGGVNIFDSNHHHIGWQGCCTATGEWVDILEGTVYVQPEVKWNNNNTRTISSSDIKSVTLQFWYSDPKNNAITAKLGNGLEFDENDAIQVKLGDGLIIDEDGAIEVTGGGSGGDSIAEGDGITITTDSQTGIKTIGVNVGNGLDIDPLTNELFVNGQLPEGTIIKKLTYVGNGEANNIIQFTKKPLGIITLYGQAVNNKCSAVPTVIDADVLMSLYGSGSTSQSDRGGTVCCEMSYNDITNELTLSKGLDAGARYNISGETYQMYYLTKGHTGSGTSVNNEVSVVKTFSYTGTGTTVNNIQFPETPDYILNISGPLGSVGDIITDPMDIQHPTTTSTYIFHWTQNGSGLTGRGLYSFNDSTNVLTLDGQDYGATLNYADNVYYVRYIVNEVIPSTIPYDAGEAISIETIGGLQPTNYSNDDFVDSIANINGGTIVKAADNSSFTLTATYDDCYTQGPSLESNGSYPYNVKASTKYRFAWDSANPDKYGAVYVFENGQYGDMMHTGDQHDVSYIEFTTSPQTSYIQTRFGVTYAGNSITYSNVRLYEVIEDEDQYDEISVKYNKGLSVNQNNELEVNIGTGLAFDPQTGAINVTESYEILWSGTTSCTARSSTDITLSTAISANEYRFIKVVWNCGSYTGISEIRADTLNITNNVVSASDATTINIIQFTISSDGTKLTVGPGTTAITVLQIIGVYPI